MMMKLDGRFAGDLAFRRKTVTRMSSESGLLRASGQGTGRGRSRRHLSLS